MIPVEFQSLSLRVQFTVRTKGKIEMKSFRSEDRSYVISLSDQTCTCPDFLESRILDQSVNQFGRWCKHLILALKRAGAFEDASEWHKAIVGQESGGPTIAFLVTPPTARQFMVTAGSSEDWINVYARTLRPGERVVNATGSLRQYGWSISQHRWSYGQAPPGSLEIKQSLKKIVSFVSDEKQVEIARPKLGPASPVDVGLPRQPIPISAFETIHNEKMRLRHKQPVGFLAHISRFLGRR